MKQKNTLIAELMTLADEVKPLIEALDSDMTAVAERRGD
jgi:hypothetical protein